MVESIETKLVNKDTASQQGIMDETSLQQTIVKQLKLSMPSIIEATVNHMLQNKLLDKNINTIVGTTVSAMTGEIVQPVKKKKKKKKKKTPSVRSTEETTIPGTENKATSSSTEASSAHQR
eukprot:8754528-Ditylum_brightwellii.AAC.1